MGGLKSAWHGETERMSGQVSRAILITQGMKMFSHDWVMAEIFL